MKDVAITFMVGATVGLSMIYGTNNFIKALQAKARAQRLEKYVDSLLQYSIYLSKKLNDAGVQTDEFDTIAIAEIFEDIN